MDPAGGYFYNIYQGLIKGTPWDLGISLSIVVAGAGIGIVLGSLAGYMGGYVEEVVMRATDIFLSIPASSSSLFWRRYFRTTSHRSTDA